MTCEAFWYMHVYGYIPIWYMTLCNMVHAFSLVILLSMFLHWGCGCGCLLRTFILPEDEVDIIKIVAAILLQRPQNIFIAIVVADWNLNPDFCLLYIITFCFLYPFSLLQHKCVFGYYHVFGSKRIIQLINSHKFTKLYKWKRLISMHRCCITFLCNALVGFHK